MSRNTEPQLLSIEAIIKKSELSKAYNNIPIDIKKLFLDELVSQDLQEKAYLKHAQFKKASSFITTKNSLQALPPRSKRKDKTYVPSFQVKVNQNIKSLNTSKKYRNSEQMKPESCRSVDRKKIEKQRRSRNSLSQAGFKVKIDPQKQENFQEEIHQFNKFENKQAQIDNRQFHKIRNKLNRFQFQIPLPQNNSKVRQSLSNKLLEGHLISTNCTNKQTNNVNEQQVQILERKKRKVFNTEEQQCLKRNQQKPELMNSFEQCQQNIIEQNQLGYIENDSQSETKHQIQKPLNIPEYIIATLSKQNKTRSHKQIASKPMKNFQVDFGKNDQNINTIKQKFQAHNNKLGKQPTPITSMKRRMSYNKHRRTQEQSQLQPQAILMRLLKKNDKQITYMTAWKPRTSEEQSNGPRRTSSKRQLRKKKFHVQDNVCGWEVKDTPLFFENY